MSLNENNRLGNALDRLEATLLKLVRTLEYNATATADLLERTDVLIKALEKVTSQIDRPSEPLNGR